MKLLFLLTFLASLAVSAREKGEAFIITAKDRYYKVLSPIKREKKFSVIVKNETLSNLYAKIQTGSGRNLAHITVNSSKFKSVEIDSEKGESYFLVPLAPPFQSILLDFGKRSYEIPPQK